MQKSTKVLIMIVILLIIVFILYTILIVYKNTSKITKIESTVLVDIAKEKVNVKYDLNEEYSNLILTLTSSNSEIKEIRKLNSDTNEFEVDDSFTLSDDSLSLTKNYTVNSKETYKIVFTSSLEEEVDIEIDNFELLELKVDTNELEEYYDINSIKILSDRNANLTIISSDDTKYEEYKNSNEIEISGYIEENKIKFYCTNYLIKQLSYMEEDLQSQKITIINTAKEEAEALAAEEAAKQVEEEAQAAASSTTSSTTSSSSTVSTSSSSSSNTSGITATTYIGENGKLKNYPSYGECFARIRISSIGVNLPVYFSQDSSVLNYGVGFNTGSYLPGEGGSIIMMAHNYSQFFGNFYKLVVGNTIEITTSYGVYTYTIYNMKVVNESDTSELPIQSSQEILMVYTCYPFGNTSYTTQRYVVYAS